MVRGTVARWDDDEGWGVLTSPELDGDVFAHFTHLQMEGFASLEAGDEVEFGWRSPGQDGCAYSATYVVRVTK
jgi:CspA family cold shock protein